MRCEAPTAGERDSIFGAKSVERNGPTRVESIDKTRPSNGSSLDLMQKEMHDQVRELPQFALELDKRNEYRGLDPSQMVFTGSGDSYACSLFAHYFSNGLARAADPYDLALSPEICRGKTVFITSLSGRTRANVSLARRIRRIARRRIAITSDLASPLARACEDAIRIPYDKAAVITPGTLSFTLCLVAVASTIEKIRALADLAVLCAHARRWAQSLDAIPKGPFLFTGSGIGYALSAYGAFKIQEVLGQPADYVHTEQLAHSKIFSVRETDNVVCFATRWDRKTEDLSKTLSKNGFRSHLLTSESRNPFVVGLEAAFAFQHLALTLAKKRRLREVSFLADKKRLRLSSRLIY